MRVITRGSTRGRVDARAAIWTRRAAHSRGEGRAGARGAGRGRPGARPRAGRIARRSTPPPPPPPPQAGRAFLQGCSARGDTSHRSARRGRAAKRPVAVARARGGGGRSCCRPRRRQSRAAGACGAVVDRGLIAVSRPLLTEGRSRSHHSRSLPPALPLPSPSRVRRSFTGDDQDWPAKEAGGGHRRHRWACAGRRVR